jgi:hypothetical protein
MRNHSGIGVKIFKLELFCAGHHNIKNWLRVAVKPGTEELTLRPCHVYKKKYKFPCSLLSDGVRNSIRFLELGYCTFRPTTDIGPLRCLTSLHLSDVHITGDELENLLSNSLALEKLELIHCEEIICLRIPCELPLQLPEHFFMQEAGADREQSSESLQFRSFGKARTITWRSFRNEELKHVSLQFSLLCSY